MTAFPNSDKISSIDEPLHWTDEKVALMVAACREMAFFHREHSREIGFLYKKYGFNPAEMSSEADFKRNPDDWRDGDEVLSDDLHGR